MVSSALRRGDFSFTHALCYRTAAKINTFTPSSPDRLQVSQSNSMLGSKKRNRLTEHDKPAERDEQKMGTHDVEGEVITHTRIVELDSFRFGPNTRPKTAKAFFELSNWAPDARTVCDYENNFRSMSRSLTRRQRKCKSTSRTASVLSDDPKSNEPILAAKVKAKVLPSRLKLNQLVESNCVRMRFVLVNSSDTAEHRKIDLMLLHNDFAINFHLSVNCDRGLACTVIINCDHIWQPPSRLSCAVCLFGEKRAETTTSNGRRLTLNFINEKTFKSGTKQTMQLVERRNVARAKVEMK